MPTILKIIISFCAEMFLVVVGGVIGVRLVARNPGEDTPSDGLGMFLYGMNGMIVAGIAGIIGLVIFWSVLANRCNAAEKKEGNAQLDVQLVDGVWPPPPKL